MQNLNVLEARLVELIKKLKSRYENVAGEYRDYINDRIQLCEVWLKDIRENYRRLDLNRLTEALDEFEKLV